MPTATLRSERLQKAVAQTPFPLVLGDGTLDALRR